MKNSLPRFDSIIPENVSILEILGVSSNLNNFGYICSKTGEFRHLPIYWNNPNQKIIPKCGGCIKQITEPSGIVTNYIESCQNNANCAFMYCDKYRNNMRIFTGFFTKTCLNCYYMDKKDEHAYFVLDIKSGETKLHVWTGNEFIKFDDIVDAENYLLGINNITTEEDYYYNKFIQHLNIIDDYEFDNNISFEDTNFILDLINEFNKIELDKLIEDITKQVNLHPEWNSTIEEEVSVIVDRDNEEQECVDLIESDYNNMNRCDICMEINSNLYHCNNDEYYYCEKCISNIPNINQLNVENCQLTNNYYELYYQYNSYDFDIDNYLSDQIEFTHI